MSFDDLKKADVTPKREEIKIKSGDKDLVFYANEISYLQRLNLAGIQATGGDSYSQLVVYSITDQDGKHMTIEQAQGLSDEHAEIFFVAAAKVNNQDAKKKAKSD